MLIFYATILFTNHRGDESSRTGFPATFWLLLIHSKDQMLSKILDSHINSHTLILVASIVPDVHNQKVFPKNSKVSYKYLINPEIWLSRHALFLCAGLATTQ